MTNNTKKDNNTVSALPELLVGLRRDKVTTGEGKWTVQEGTARRGDAHTDFDNRIMRVPVINDEVARLIRNHELAHAFLSPTDVNGITNTQNDAQVTQRIMECIEELRVNHHLSRQGFDLDLLQDGSEKEGGKRLAEGGSDKAWNETVAFFTALSGSKAQNAFLSGVRSVNPEWAVRLNELKKETKKWLRNHGWQVSDQDVREFDDGSSVSDGFYSTVTQLGKIINGYLAPISDESKEYVPSQAFDAGNEDGKFAKLILDSTHPLTKTVTNRLSSKAKPTLSGKRVTHPSRFLSDPQRRVFSNKRKAHGGIVVIDVSGSMPFDTDSLVRILDASMGATVIAYSHKRGSTTIPNATILARGGKRVPEVPSSIFRVGNGVDGPVLEYAQSIRKSGEPIIWVCDGQVTDGKKDSTHAHLSKQVAQFLRRHRIIQVEDIEEAVKVIAKPTGVPYGARYGRVSYYPDSE